jgi:predicted O-methyltransferase YrrM
MLNTGWKLWDKYLSHLAGKKNIKALEIGAYKGDSSMWILNNLFTDDKSKLYVIDVFANSDQNKQEYGNDIDFEDIEKIFHKNIKSTKKEKQVKLYKEYSHFALSKLLLDKKELESFDFIYIDASHDAIDVMTDGCLSWKLLKPEGILIFDDYIWDIFHQDFFRPRLAIDSFLAIFKSELYILEIKRQAYVKKRPKDRYIKPIKKNAV